MNFSVDTNLKKPKMFLKGDLVIYPLLFVLVIILFFVFTFPKGQNSSAGFSCQIDGQTVFTYTFDGDNLNVENSKKEFVLYEKFEWGYLITVKSQLNNDRYNVIKIDVNEKTACVIESTCSSSKDCTHIPSIRDTGAIYCAPHKLKLSALSQSDFRDPVTGGL